MTISTFYSILLAIAISPAILSAAEFLFPNVPLPISAKFKSSTYDVRSKPSESVSQSSLSERQTTYTIRKQEPISKKTLFGNESTDGQSSQTHSIHPEAFERNALKGGSILKNGLDHIKLAEITNMRGYQDNLNKVETVDIESQPSFSENDVKKFKGGRINIADLYPSKLEDFNPVTFESKAGFEIKKIINPSNLNTRDKETDFTGKLLQEQDGVITEIERKFQLSDLIGHSTNVPHTELLDRRVKKSFEFPTHINKPTADVVRHIDFASTKFNTENRKALPSEAHPEFSTTKFYNSKELYSDVLNKNVSTARSLNLTYPNNTTVGNLEEAHSSQAEDVETSTLPVLIDTVSEIISTLVAPTNVTYANSPLPSPSEAQQPATTMYAEDNASDLNTSDPNKSILPTIISPLKPIARPRVLSRLEEKINSLECDIQRVPPNSHLWRGNETHELMLPITATCNMKGCDDRNLSWIGVAGIQSGDVLIVEINDSILWNETINSDHSNANVIAHNTLVYQVTRPGHEHCDVTEGVLLDITPLEVDGKKLVTLYDKDLTEGTNLLIVVSELWGVQCVRLKVTVKSDNCGENAECSGKGLCFSNESMEGYECQCCNGFAGPHCEEIDACSPSPCTNNGICVDLSQGHEGNSYQCLCPYGYTGKNCQYESDPCNSAECMNGGSCLGNSTHFRCDCAPGYSGPLCQHNLNECESSPCMHGICVDQEDGFRCFCQPGFAGERCNFEYNECESNPCLNGGECIDKIGGFECKCARGYTGLSCQDKVDFCATNPCPQGHKCLDHENDYSCECPGGRDGPDCNRVPRTQCNVNPCANGGTCWTSGDSFYCACRPGYTGQMCEDEFVVETVVSSSEYMVDDTSSFDEKSLGSVVLKNQVEFHNVYIAAGVLAAAIFIVAIVVSICHCKVNETYRKFSTRQTNFFPILGFGKRPKLKAHRHWLSGKPCVNSNHLQGISNKANKSHLTKSTSNSSLGAHQHGYQEPHQRPFQRHLAMNFENDMYYTVDFNESQHLPLIK